MALIAPRTLDAATLAACMIKDPVERQREIARLKRIADHACGFECPSCDRQAGIEHNGSGGFYCHGCGHEWERDDMLADI